ncbi:ABC transporter ATP-binding protein [Ammoniphilus sp. YIM 78166]|uniref:ABC transporter ATP-binding protein n=1 Tax=Ammoniphilus sp. YIM 78166 TaxID=1644106 RepID=UPI00106F57D4
MTVGKQTPAIEIDSLSKVYSDRNEEVVAIKEVNLSIPEGKFVSVVGPSGCGKSTFLHIVGGFIPKTKGTVRIRGKEVDKPGPDRGMMFQESALFPWKTVSENVAWGLEIQGVPKQERQGIVENYLKLVHLWEFRNHLPSQLSGGMKQRISLARVLAFNPDVLLMDEPFGALDAQTRENMQVELQRIWKESQKSVLFVTHDIDEAVFLSDIVVVFTGRPAVIKEIIEIDFPRPRNLDIHKTKEFTDYRNYIWDLLHQEHAKPHLKVSEVVNG